MEWAVTARDDLEAIAAYIAVDSAINALKVVERIEARAETLSSLPMRGRVVPELRWHGVMTFQELIEKPWRLIYRIESHRVVVVSVLDGRRSLEDLLLDRFVR
ncbi:MAG: type II toxin-antitoxin system RelE/ParE family toxin [Planctomycetes bacterium]|nr:type II toxin-antitoxin system RelE/ParE family toxin [Planctomycetota bacterium]